MRSESSFRRKLDRVTDYMSYRAIPPRLQRRVRDYYTYLWDTRRGIDEATVFSFPPRRIHSLLDLCRPCIQSLRPPPFFLLVMRARSS